MYIRVCSTKTVRTNRTLSILAFYGDKGCTELTNRGYFTLVSIHNTIIHEDG